MNISKRNEISIKRNSNDPPCMFELYWKENLDGKSDVEIIGWFTISNSSL